LRLSERSPSRGTPQLCKDLWSRGYLHALHPPSEPSILILRRYVATHHLLFLFVNCATRR